MQGTVKYSFLKEIKRRSMSAQTLKNQVFTEICLLHRAPSQENEIWSPVT